MNLEIVNLQFYLITDYIDINFKIIFMNFKKFTIHIDL